MNFLAVLFLLIGLFSLGYTAAIIVYSGINTAFLWFWIGAALGSILLFVLLRLASVHKAEAGRHVKFGFVLILLSGLAVFTLVEGLIVHAGNKRPQEGAGYVIVLGAQVRGTALSRALKNRLDTAYGYLVKNESARVIVSGGRGYGEDISEARAMKDYLIGKGLKAERILMEDKSTNTYENLLYSKALMKQENQKTVIVTNSFHVFRAVSIARKLGITEVNGLGAPVNDILVLNYYVREFFAVVKDMLAGNI